MGEGGVIKSVVIFLLLAVFSLVAGSMVADSAKEAIIPALLVAGVAALIYLGKNCWWLIFIAPPAISAFGFMQNMPVAYGFCGIILLYWILLTCLGYTKMTWNGVKGLDVITLIMVLYFLSTWVRHPVTIDAFVSIYDEGDAEVGGRDYIWCIGSVLFYLTLSVIPIELKGVVKVLKVSFWITFVSAFFVVTKSLVFPSAGVNNFVVGSEEELRYSPYLSLGAMMCRFLFAKYTMAGILLSPWKIIIFILSFASIAKSGFRSLILDQLVYITSVYFCRRQIFIFIIFGCFAWGGVVAMSHAKCLDFLPFGIQRSLSAVPGYAYSDAAAGRSAQDSLTWRYELWEMGWNPKTGYIVDYVWGDGYAIVKSEMRRKNTLLLRGEINGIDNRYFAEAGLWHNGPLVVVHKTGFVGLIILSCWFFIFIPPALRLCSSLFNMQGREYVYVFVLPLLSSIVLFYASAGGWIGVYGYGGAMFYASFVKVLYSEGIKEGVIQPYFGRKLYVPMLLRTMNNMI